MSDPVKSNPFYLNDYLTSSGKHPDRLKSTEITKTVRENALVFLGKLNGLLAELGITDAVFSSGFRTTRANGKLVNSAKKSKHIRGEGGDLQGGLLADRLFKNNDLLVKHKLYLEHPDCTTMVIGTKLVRWTHVQSVPPRSGKLVFKCGICPKCKGKG